MKQLLGAVVGISLIASIFNFLFLAIAIPAALALFFLLRKTQPEQVVDERYLGGAQPTAPGARDTDHHAT